MHLLSAGDLANAWMAEDGFTYVLAFVLLSAGQWDPRAVLLPHLLIVFISIFGIHVKYIYIFRVIIFSHVISLSVVMLLKFFPNPNV